MYRTCLFCKRDLGSNETIVAFPIGRRLAFDPAKGRLWVVCPRCMRWNLSPLEERWEAIEVCERVYRGTRLRAATENIGLAHLRDGTELVRVGRPERPEMAAWRYAPIFARRRRKSWLITGAAVAASVPLLWTGAYAAAAAMLPGGGLLLQLPNWIWIYRSRRQILTRVASDDEFRLVRRKHLTSAAFLSEEGAGEARWSFGIKTDSGPVRVEGDQARQIAVVVLAQWNQRGGGNALVRRAVERLENAADHAALFAEAAKSNPAAVVDAQFGAPGTRLHRLSRDQRLALEMIAHEETERRALEGELKALELAWQEAERIAAISDDLLLPSRVYETIERNRR